MKKQSNASRSAVDATWGFTNPHVVKRNSIDRYPIIELDHFLVKKKSTQQVPSAAIAEGKRTPNSLTPRIFMLKTWSHITRGGFVLKRLGSQ